MVDIDTFKKNVMSNYAISNNIKKLLQSLHHKYNNTKS